MSNGKKRSAAKEREITKRVGLISAFTVVLIIVALLFLLFPGDGPFGEILFGLAAVISAVVDITRRSSWNRNAQQRAGAIGSKAARKLR